MHFRSMLLYTGHKMHFVVLKCYTISFLSHSFHVRTCKRTLNVGTKESFQKRIIKNGQCSVINVRCKYNFFYSSMEFLLRRIKLVPLLPFTVFYCTGCEIYFYLIFLWFDDQILILFWFIGIWNRVCWIELWKSYELMLDGVNQVEEF